MRLVAVFSLMLSLLAFNAAAQTPSLLTGITEEMPKAAPEKEVPKKEAPKTAEKTAEKKDSPTNPAPAETGSGVPLEITADNSLEWQRNGKTLIARGHALAKQGDTSVAADTLTAHYTEKTGGGMKISEVQADNSVIVRSKDSAAYGSKATYDLDKGYAVMTGDNLRMVSPAQEVTAHDKFEYWVTDGKLVATGRALAKRGTDTLEADKITATLKDNAKGQRAIDTLEAEGNVVITTPTETVTGAYGIYRAATDKAELKGGVKIHRGPNILEGDRAEVDMAANTSRIFGGPSEGGRVKGVFYPGSDKKP